MGEIRERLREALAGRYQIVREAGEGGMATVYLARDLKHDRDVALKVLKPELAAAVGQQRFLREIRIAAGLQHPGILPLYDSGEAGGFLYYVMPFVDGMTLHQRIERYGPLAMEEAVAIARDIAEALEYAHGKGLVHRDIKPGNVLFLNGRPVLCDFGLATAASAVGEERLTQTGMVVGTPLYMSPEQASGKRDVDSKSDLYSFGCVVYEMLAGHPPFTGGSPRAVLARHLSDPVPPLRTVRPQLAAGVDGVLRKALAKEPADRHESATALVEALRAPGPQRALPGKPALAGAVVLAAVAVSLAVLRPWKESGRLSRGRSLPLTTLTGIEYSGSLSPDSLKHAFSHPERGVGNLNIFMQARDGGAMVQLTDAPGDELLPRWSRDGSALAYVAGNGNSCDVYRLWPDFRDVREPELLVETGIPYLHSFWDAMMSLGSAPWSPDGGSFLFSRCHANGEVAVHQLDLETGAETQVTFPDRGTHDLSSSWSFDGRQVVFARTNGGNSGLWLVELDEDGWGAPRELLVDAAVNYGEPAFLPGDRHVVFSSNRSGAVNMWAVHLDSGELTQLTSGGGQDQHPSVSNDGLVAYTQFSHQTDLYVLSVDTGESSQLTSWTKDNFVARYSPDGSRIAYQSTRDGDAEVWVRSAEPGDRNEKNLTNDEANDSLPAWSPDGEWIAFLSNRTGDNCLWKVRSDGKGVPEIVLAKDIPIPSEVWGVNLSIRWTPDGESIGYLLAGDDGPELWVVDADGTDDRLLAKGVWRFDWYGEDGERVVYTSLTRDRLELRARSLETGQDVLLYDGAHTEMILSPDGSAVAFVRSASHFDQQLFLLELTGPDPVDALPRRLGEPMQLTDGRGVWHVHNGGWSPDGRQIVYTQDTDDGDIWMIEQDG
jgi:Tol biopolymer transport system component